VLDPGEAPEVKCVTKWDDLFQKVRRMEMTDMNSNKYPAHEQLRGVSKIPTVIYYDQQGVVRCWCGGARRQSLGDGKKEG